MAIRQTVVDLLELGPLPASDDAIADDAIAKGIDAFYERLMAIARPVTEEEALALMSLFGPDDCFGVAWTLLHLIETCPTGVPIPTKPDPEVNEWIRYLWDRSHREWL
jgi:hypothetical protein